MWNWQTIKYGRTACMLFYVRRSAAAGILASGSAAAAVQAAVGGGAAAAAAAHDRNTGGATAVTSGVALSASAPNSNNATLLNSVMKKNVTVTSASQDIWNDQAMSIPASLMRDNCSQSLLRTDDYTDLRKALLQLNRPDALAAFQLHNLDDSAVDLAQHEQHLEYLGLTAKENARLMEIWQNLRGLGASTASALRDLPIDVKLRSLAITPAAAAASVAPRSVISPCAATLPVFNNPSLSMRSIAEIASALCIKSADERLNVDSDDENETEYMTTSSVQHLPSYIRAYHPRILSQLRVFNVSRLFVRIATCAASQSLTRYQCRLQHVTGPIEPVVTLEQLAPDASLLLAWTVPSPSHVAISVCVGTWGVGDPSPTYVGNPVVVYVQLGDEMRVVKERAVEVLQLPLAKVLHSSDCILCLQCFFQRYVGDGQELARRRLNQLNDEICLLSESGETVRIQDEDLVSDYYLPDAQRHAELEGSHGYVMNLMLLRGQW
jgi:hypothetical protein